MRKHKIVPDSIATCRELSRHGISAMENGDPGEAQALLERAVATSPSDLDARRQLAEILWINGAHRDATIHMETAVQLDPRHAPTLVRSGEMLLNFGNVRRAMERAQQAIALDATLAGAWALRGRVFRKQGNHNRALADLQQSLRFAPHETEVLIELAELNYAIGRPERSLTTLHYLLDIYPPGDESQQVLWLEGLVYGALERHDDAVKSLYAASKRGEPRAELLYQLACAEQAAGHTVDAEQTLRRALAVNAGHQPSQVMMAQLQDTVPTPTDAVIRR